MERIIYCKMIWLLAKSSENAWFHRYRPSKLENYDISGNTIFCENFIKKKPLFSYFPLFSLVPSFNGNYCGMFPLRLFVGDSWHCLASSLLQTFHARYSPRTSLEDLLNSKINFKLWFCTLSKLMGCSSVSISLIQPKIIIWLIVACYNRPEQAPFPSFDASTKVL